MLWKEDPCSHLCRIREFFLWWKFYIHHQQIMLVSAFALCICSWICICQCICVACLSFSSDDIRHNQTTPVSQIYSLFERPRCHPVENPKQFSSHFRRARGSSGIFLKSNFFISKNWNWNLTFVFRNLFGPCGPPRWDVDYLRLLLLRHLRHQHKLWRLLLLLQLLHRSFCGRVWMWVSNTMVQNVGKISRSQLHLPGLGLLSLLCWSGPDNFLGNLIWSTYN